MEKNKKTVKRRVFLMVMDSVGIGNAPDADKFGDEGSNTLKSCYNTGNLNIPFIKRMGILNIDGINYGKKEQNPLGIYGRIIEKSADKDTITGHREMMGIISERKMPTFPNGFPEDFIREFEKRIGRSVICNKPYSGTDVLKDYGKEHINTGNIIVYTSGDSVFQIAAHIGIVSIEELYNICKVAREMLTGNLAVGRVIARPFAGVYPNFERISRLRHDYSLPVAGDNILEDLHKINVKTIAVGKINDIFGGYGFDKSYTTGKNEAGFQKCFELLDSAPDNSFSFINFVDFDADFGHRRNPKGYTECLNTFDKFLERFIFKMSEKDLLIVTADHGCDPCFTKTTDHTRECVPVLIYSKNIVFDNKNLGTIIGFDNIGKVVQKYFAVASKEK